MDILMVAIWIFHMCVGDFVLFGFAALQVSFLLRRESHCRCTEYNHDTFIWHSFFIFIVKSGFRFIVSS